MVQKEGLGKYPSKTDIIRFTRPDPYPWYRFSNNTGTGSDISWFSIIQVLSHHYAFRQRTHTVRVTGTSSSNLKEFILKRKTTSTSRAATCPEIIALWEGKVPHRAHKRKHQLVDLDVGPRDKLRPSTSVILCSNRNNFLPRTPFAELARLTRNFQSSEIASEDSLAVWWANILTNYESKHTPPSLNCGGGETQSVFFLFFFTPLDDKVAGRSGILLQNKLPKERVGTRKWWKVGKRTSFAPKGEGWRVWKMGCRLKRSYQLRWKHSRRLLSEFWAEFKLLAFPSSLPNWLEMFARNGVELNC